MNADKNFVLSALIRVYRRLIMFSAAHAIESGTL
jgi:hypothetical protein